MSVTSRVRQRQIGNSVIGIDQIGSLSHGSVPGGSGRPRLAHRRENCTSHGINLGTDRVLILKMKFEKPAQNLGSLGAGLILFLLSPWL